MMARLICFLVVLHTVELGASGQYIRLLPEVIFSNSQLQRQNNFYLDAQTRVENFREREGSSSRGRKLTEGRRGNVVRPMQPYISIPAGAGGGGKLSYNVLFLFPKKNEGTYCFPSKKQNSDAFGYQQPLFFLCCQCRYLPFLKVRIPLTQATYAMRTQWFGKVTADRHHNDALLECRYSQDERQEIFQNKN